MSFKGILGRSPWLTGRAGSLSCLYQWLFRGSPSLPDTTPFRSDFCLLLYLPQLTPPTLHPEFPRTMHLYEHAILSPITPTLPLLFPEPEVPSLALLTCRTPTLAKLLPSVNPPLTRPLHPEHTALSIFITSHQNKLLSCRFHTRPS